MILLLQVLLTAVITLQQVSSDDVDAERDLLARALTLLAEQPMSDELVETYKDLHGRAWRLGEVETAHAAIERIAVAWEERLASDAVGLGVRLHELGNLLEGRGDFAAARDLLVRAVALLEASHGPGHPDVAVALNSLGITLWRLGELSEARASLERMVSIAERAHGPTHPDVAMGLGTLGLVLDAMGEPAEAKPMLERAVAILSESQGSDLDLAQALINLSTCLTRLEDHEGARDAIQRAVAIFESAPGGAARLLLAQAYSNLATALRELGRPGEATPLHARAVAMLEEVRGEGHPDVALALQAQALHLQELGEEVAARRAVERSLAIREDVFGPDHPLVAQALEHLGQLLGELGDHTEARALHERALAIREEVLGPDHPHVAVALQNLASRANARGAPLEARELYERSLAINEEVWGPDHPKVARSLCGLGSVVAALGDPAQGRAMQERALSILEAALGPEDPEVSNVLGHLAIRHIEAGEFDLARERFERSLEIDEAALGPGHPWVAYTLVNLAGLEHDAGRLDRAAQHASRLALDGARTRRLLAALTEGEAHRYLAARASVRDALLAIAAVTDDARGAYAHVLEHKGQVARLAHQTVTGLRSTLDPATRALADELSVLQGRLSRMAVAREVVDAEAHAERMEALRARREDVERQLRSRVPGEVSPAVGPEEVAAALPPGTALVDILVHRGRVPSRAPGGGAWRAPHVSAWVLRADDGALRWIDLGPATAIEEALEDHRRRLMGASAPRGVVVSGGGVDEAGGERLRSLVWAPLAAAIGDVHTLFVSPDGALGLLPLETLEGEDGRFLVEDLAFVYLPDATVLATRAHESPALGAALLAAGGADYDHPGATSSRAQPGPGSPTFRMGSDGPGSSWAPLPATASEVQRIAELHEATRPAAGRRVLLGRQASETQLTREMPQASIVHVATHGYFRPAGLPSLERQALGALESVRADPDRKSLAGRLTGLHPGLLSGLVLAGANRSGVSRREASGDIGQDDGYLTASDVGLLDLAEVDLVVLSACETGLGRPQAGEGLLGLRRAFHVAGADTVISSLWAVGDEATEALMVSFYENLLASGMGRHEALRAAQLDALARHRRESGEARPELWGAFVLSGEWR